MSIKNNQPILESNDKNGITLENLREFVEVTQGFSGDLILRGTQYMIKSLFDSNNVKGGILKSLTLSED